jgi:3-deoxy-D-manno-octulosonic-acid transferase
MFLSMSIARFVYCVLHICAIPIIVLRLVWRARVNSSYLDCVHQRFALGLPRFDGLRPLWIHAVSVGEAQAAVPLARELMSRYPQHPILFTTTTPTGRDRVRQVFGDSVVHCYTPYDLPWIVSRFLKTVRPVVLVVMETELWPNLFAQCNVDKIPIVLANVRLSVRSTRGYRRIGALSKEMLARVQVAAAQSQADATRLLSLGIAAEHVEVTGSVKFDMSVAASLREQAQVLRRELGIERSVFIAASTHDGEDAQVLQAFAHVLQTIPRCLLVLVPRHPERFAETAALCRKRGFNTALRSKTVTDFANVDIYLGDSMGDLPLLYAASDIAFVGGSLVATGGHNMLEPAALGLPVLFGPNVFNFSEISRLLLHAGAAWQVTDARELGERARALLQDANLRHNAGDAGRQFVLANRGALSKLLILIDKQLALANG